MKFMVLAISILSLIISVLTFWLTRIKRGNLRMTRPSIIAFLGPNGDDESKIFIRTLLYATSDKGQYIQSMFARLSGIAIIQNFNIWAYGDNGVVRGSGLFASKSGLSVYHHFLLPKNEKWQFKAGEYQLEVFAESINGRINKLFEQRLSLTQEQSYELQHGKALYFDWVPNIKQYVSHIDKNRSSF